MSNIEPWKNLEQHFVDALIQGHPEDIIELIKYLPEERKQQYRKIYKEHRSKQVASDPKSPGHP